MKLKNIFENNKAWVKKKLDVDPDYFERLSRGQKPEILYIGCSDSRVTAEELMGISSGDAFVHRNIANLVPNNDLNAISVLQYAVEHLEVKHVVVCGHYYCGGVKAAMESADYGVLNPWLRNIRDVYRIYRLELDAIEDIDERYKRLVELNVREQCVNVMKNAVVQVAVMQRDMEVHGWVFDIRTGALIDLKIDVDEIMNEIMKVYRIDR